ncbi:MAG: hypothetical protein MJZ30_12750 [Paludibacteraceae bacterium]|nr:hypothetical protein [Paludibacteraceae bacterium]
MKTRFFFPVVAMIAFATVTNAAAFKLGVNESGVEVASVEKVDARAGVETSVLGTSLSGLTSGLACGAETSVCGTRLSGLASVFTSGAEMDIKVDKRVDFRMDVDAKAGAELARRMDVDAKAGTKAGVCGAGQKGLTSGFECGAKTSIQVTAGMDGRAAI